MRARKIKKILKWTALGIISIILILVLTAAIIILVGAHQYDAEIAQIKEEGKPVTPADLRGPKIPDSQNAAVVYEKVFAQMHKSEFQKYNTYMENESLTNRAEFNWPELNTALGKTEKIIPLIQEAVNKPKCQFNVDWESVGKNYIPNFKTNPRLLSAYPNIRSLSRFLGVSAIINAHENRMDKSVELSILGVRNGNSLRYIPVSIAALVRFAAIAITTRCLQISLKYGDVTESQAKQIYDELSKIDLRNDFVKVLEGERACSLAAAVNGTNGNKKGYLQKYFESSLLAAQRQQIPLVKMTYRETETKGLIVDYNKGLPIFNILPGMLMPVMNREWIERDNAMANIAVTQVGLACLAYKARTKKFPNSLTDIKTILGWKIPQDPFSGKDLIYRRQDKGFIVYSIGSNLVDDGGFEPKIYRGSPDVKGDIVWRYNENLKGD